MSLEERWQLSGNAPKFYERYVRLMMEPWVRRLVDVAALRPAEQVLDVACGTGFVARLAAERVGADGRVVGIDLNESMIEAARAVSSAETRNNIDWRTADAAALPFADAIFDWSSVSKACSSFLIASRRCVKCDAFSTAEAAWPSRCGAPSRTSPTPRPSPMRSSDT